MLVRADILVPTEELQTKRSLTATCHFFFLSSYSPLLPPSGIFNCSASHGPINKDILYAVNHL